MSSPSLSRQQGETCQADAALIITRIPFVKRDYAYAAGHGTGYTFQLELQSLSRQKRCRHGLFSINCKRTVFSEKPNDS